MISGFGSLVIRRWKVCWYEKLNVHSIQLCGLYKDCQTYSSIIIESRQEAAQWKLVEFVFGYFHFHTRFTNLYAIKYFSFNLYGQSTQFYLTVTTNPEAVSEGSLLFNMPSNGTAVWPCCSHQLETAHAAIPVAAFLDSRHRSSVRPHLFYQN